ncbi:MAG TPA: hypothetical protein VE690_07805 [Rhodopila sp.]|nr:hypothetical protein [Rhodopila sp.]
MLYTYVPRHVMLHGVSDATQYECARLGCQEVFPGRDGEFLHMIKDDKHTYVSFCCLQCQLLAMGSSFMAQA